MRAFRATATATTAALLGVVILSGCGLARPDHALVTFTAEATAGGSGPAPRDTSAPAPEPEPGAPSPPPATAETIVTVTRSGGFAGRTHTLSVSSDGSWTRRGAHAEPEGGGLLSSTQLGRLRAAVEAADFAHLSRTAKSGGTVFDGFTYTFVRGGLKVVTNDGSVPAVLTKLLDALPPFEG
ncbi:hypothetical protein ABZ934_07330 [Streptomyces sp. NPDC046557]|uniref:hypothetical protein n=1 Tax=Streptomyces sp. NPDC046557 TaxID=3155372 RepID=UPI0033D06D7D